MKRIPLTRGEWALVDDTLFDALMALGPWICRQSRTRKRRYAHRHVYRNGKRTTELMHRLIFKLMGHQPPRLVDHEDMDGLNNQWSNLRRASPTESSRHRSKQRGHVSKFKGVGFRKDRGKWIARIYDVKRHGRTSARTLGHFDTEIEAAKAYDTAAKRSYGVMAYLNFPN